MWPNSCALTEPTAADELRIGELPIQPAIILAVMRLFAFGAPAQTVVKSYGRDSLLLWINPLISAMQASLGMRVGLRSEADVFDKMQKDVLAMADRGYRVAASDEYELPVLLAAGRRASYYRVTYELIKPPSG